MIVPDGDAAADPEESVGDPETKVDRDLDNGTETVPLGLTETIDDDDGSVDVAGAELESDKDPMSKSPEASLGLSVEPPWVESFKKQVSPFASGIGLKTAPTHVP